MPEPEMPQSLGRYQIVGELGRGAMGIVYEGKDPVIGRRVAIKTARRDAMDKTGRADEMMERFLREARAAGTLNHPNIITIYDADEENGVAYIAMEYIERGTLRDLMAANRRMDAEQVVHIGALMCNALAAAHQQGIVHRDIKPANIMMLPNGSVKVADFGIAHVSDSTLTQEGSMIGTPHFMSPEQFMGHKIDGSSDLFSVGVIMYEMLTGEKPFEGEALSTVMHKVLKVEPVPPKELNFAVDDYLSRAVMKAMSKRPGNRYQNGTAMADALLESVKEHPDLDILDLEPPDSAIEKTIVLDQPDATVAATTLPNGNHPPAADGAPPTPTDATSATAVSGTSPADTSGPSPAPRARELGTTRPLRGAGAAKLRRRAVASGVVAIAALVVVASVWLTTRGGDAGEQAPGTTPAADEPGWTELYIEIVCLADSKEGFQAAKADNYQHEDCDLDGTVDVDVTDSDTGESLLAKGEGKAVYAEVLTFRWPSRRFKVVFSRDGYEPSELHSDEASFPDQQLKTPVVLMRRLD